jgi:uncharacterized protein YprB with RNaseH-like and TPR domain
MNDIHVYLYIYKYCYSGDTYKTNVALSRDGDIEEIPSIPDNLISQTQSLVFFDLETTGLGKY